MKNIIETAVEAGQFKTLAAALTQAGWVDKLSEAGPFTVFAPTDAAFTKIPEEVLKAVLADTQKLAALLQYHVVAGKWMAHDVVTKDHATTLQGSDVTIKAEGGKVWINSAEVIKTDIECSNGVIHVIDSVLMPA